MTKLSDKMLSQFSLVSKFLKSATHAVRYLRGSQLIRIVNDWMINKYPSIDTKIPNFNIVKTLSTLP